MGLNFFQKNKRMILAVVLIGLIAAPLALVPVETVKALEPGTDPNGPTAGDVNYLKDALQVSVASVAPLAYVGGKVGEVAANFAMCFTKGGFSDCFVGAIADFILKSVQPFLSLALAVAGGVLDQAIKFALDTTWLRNVTVIKDGWKLIRDLANMGFIFILLYIAISTILQLSSYNIRSALVRLIIAAILINFSFFFTGVIMDAGNIVANNFYSALTSNNTTSLSRQFTLFVKLDSTYNAVNGFDQTLGTPLGKVLGGKEYLTRNLLVIILTSISIYVFFSVALLFIGRSITFVFLLMLAPIGFVGKVIPGLSGAADKWWKNLWHQTLLAPVFLILLYLVFNLMKALDMAVPSVGAAGSSGQPNVPITFYFNFILVMGLLIVTLRITRGLSSEIGIMIEKSVKKAMAWTGGITLAAAATVASMGATAAVGGLAARAAASGGLKNLAATTGTGLGASFKRFTGRTGIKLADKVAGSSFDVRNVGVFRKTAGLAGIKVDKSKFREGGYKATQERKTEKAREFAEKLAPSEVEKQQKLESYMAAQRKKKDLEKQAEEKAKTNFAAIGQTPVTEADKQAAKAAVDKAREEQQLAQQLKSPAAIAAANNKLTQAEGHQAVLRQNENAFNQMKQTEMERLAGGPDKLNQINQEVAKRKAEFDFVDTSGGKVSEREKQYAQQMKQPGIAGAGPTAGAERGISNATDKLSEKIKEAMTEAGGEAADKMAKAMGTNIENLKKELELAMTDLNKVRPGAIGNPELRNSIFESLEGKIQSLAPAFTAISNESAQQVAQSATQIKQNLASISKPEITELITQKVSWTPQWKREAADKIIAGEKLKKKKGGKDKKKFLEDLAEMLGEELPNSTPSPKPPAPPPTPPTTS